MLCQTHLNQHYLSSQLVYSIKCWRACVCFITDIRTERVYVDWIKRFILFRCKRNPKEMGASEVEAFLTHLRWRGRCQSWPLWFEHGNRVFKWNPCLLHAASLTAGSSAV